MDALLISPRSRSVGLESAQKGSQILQGVLYVAAAARKAGFEALVTVADENDIVEQVQKWNPKIVGFSCVTASYPIVKEMVRLLKSHDSSILTIIGGHHATFMTQNIFVECPVDYICRGEGEEAFPSLLSAIQEKNLYPEIPGIAYRKNNTIFNADQITLLNHLDDLPRITFDLVAPGLGFSPKIVTSRGCPYQCSFCSISAFYNGSFRQRKVEDVISDIQTYYDTGHREFWFHDDNLTVNSEWVRRMCNALKEKKLKIRWNCMARIDNICRDPEMVTIMAEAGCSMMSIGIESGIQDILHRFNKKLTVEQIHQAIKILKKANVFHNWFIIIGSGDEYDTPTYLDQNIKFFESIPYDIMLISILTPLPGTELYKKLEIENRLLHQDWEKFDMAHCVYQPIGVTPQELESYLGKAYKRLYIKRGWKNIPVAIHGIRSGAIRMSSLRSYVKLYLNMQRNKMSLDGALKKIKKT